MGLQTCASLRTEGFSKRFVLSFVLIPILWGSAGKILNIKVCTAAASYTARRASKEVVGNQKHVFRHSIYSILCIDPALHHELQL